MKGLLIGFVTIACAVGFLGAIAPHARANAPPNIEVTGPAGGIYVPGEPVSVTWNLSDDHDRVAALVVWVNYTGPASGAIAGPLAGTTREFLWFMPSSLVAGDYRITAVAFDAQGASSSAEGPLFTVVPLPKTPTFPLGPSAAEIGVVSFLVASGVLVFLIAAFGPALVGRPERGDAWKVRSRRRRKGLKPVRKAEYVQRPTSGHSRNQ